MEPPVVIDPERLLSVFLDLVKIESEPGREGEAARYVKNFLDGLGIECVEDSCGRKTGGQSGNLIAKIPSNRGSSGSPLILNAHLDTVQPGTGIVPLITEDRIESSGDTVLGADDKAGVAAILVAVEAAKHAGAGHGALEVLLTVQEETGLRGSRNMDFSLIDGEYCVVLDGAGAVGGIVLEAPTQEHLRFFVTGRSAHAGVEPEKGRNAICCAAEAISRLKIGRLDERTTTNIGIIEGGTAINIVPDRVLVEGEVRGFENERVSMEVEKVVSAFKSSAATFGCGLAFETMENSRHFKVDRSSTPSRLLARAMRNCGTEPTYEISGGCSDANVFNRNGITAITMHIGVRNAHSTGEYIKRDDLTKVASIVAALAAMSDGDPGT